VIRGYPDYSFRPDTTINRAEFLKIVTLHKYGSAMVEMCGTQGRYTDIPYGAWYEKYACRATNAGLVSGYLDGTFRPAQTINFAEAAKIVVNAFIGIPPQIRHDEAWHVQYIQALSRVGAIPPSLNDAATLVTRGEMVEMIYQLDTGGSGPPDRSARSGSVFDGCGSLSSYANKSWYSGFTSAVQTNFPFEVAEVCFSTNRNIVIAIVNVTECSGADVFLYDISTGSAEMAQLDLQQIFGCMVFSEFGKRVGDIVPVIALSYEDECPITIHYNYNLVENTVSFSHKEKNCEESEPLPASDLSGTPLEILITMVQSEVATDRMAATKEVFRRGASVLPTLEGRIFPHQTKRRDMDTLLDILRENHTASNCKQDEFGIYLDKPMSEEAITALGNTYGFSRELSCANSGIPTCYVTVDAGYTLTDVTVTLLQEVPEIIDVNFFCWLY